MKLSSGASCERSFIHEKHENNYIRCSQREERLSNLVFISMSKDLLKR